jgi:uncharacterized repeat protein (TIGR01451 family)
MAAIALVQNIGTNGSGTSGTTISVTVPAAGVAAGDTVVVSVALDPAVGPVTCADTGGNAYSVDADRTNGSGTSGVRTVVCSAAVATALPAGASITVTHPSVTATAISASEFSGLAGASRVDRTASATGATSAASSGSTAPTTQPDELLIGSIATETKKTETFTPGTGYSAMLREQSSQTGSLTSNVTIDPEFRIVFATASYVADGTLQNARPWAAAIVTYRAAVSGTTTTTTSTSTTTTTTIQSTTTSSSSSTTSITGPTSTSTTINTTTTSTTSSTTSTTSSTTTTTTAPFAQIAVTKADAVTTLVPGTATAYSIVVRNLGPSDAAGVQVTDTPPPGLIDVAWTCVAGVDASCAASGGTGVLDTTVSLPLNASASFVLTGTVVPDATGDLTNTVEALPPPGLGAPSSATDTDLLTPQADLAISTSGPATVVPGTDVVYTIVVQNNGPSTGSGVVVDNPTPAGLSFISNAGDCTTPFACFLGSMPPGATRTIVTTLTVPPGYTTPNPIIDAASVTSAAEDIVPSNNSASVQTAVDSRADVSVSKTMTPTSALVGDTVTATVTVANHGPNRASGVVVTDVLPAGLMFATASQTQGIYDAMTGQWPVGDLASGDAAVLTIAAVVTQPGGITNLATRTAGNEPDPDTSNDSACGPAQRRRCGRRGHSENRRPYGPIRR